MNREQPMEAMANRHSGMSGRAIANVLNVPRHVVVYALGRLRNATENLLSIR